VAVDRHAWEDPRFQTFNELPEDRYEAFLSVPVLSRGKVVGVINLQHRQPHSHSQREIRLISMIGFLVGAEIELVNRPSRETVMRRALAGLRDAYEFVLIDCPPSLGLITLNMLTASDSVLIPIQCEYYALEGLSQLLNTVKLVQQNFNPDLAIEGVLLTMFDNRLNLSRQVAMEANEYFGAKMFQVVIPRSVRLAEAPSFGKPILMYDVQSVGAKGYLALAQEVIRRAQAATPARLRPAISSSPKCLGGASAINCCVEAIVTRSCGMV